MPTWRGASGQGSLPASSAPMPGDETLCTQYYRDGTCSKGASCERLHGIYCKVPRRSLLVMASRKCTASPLQSASPASLKDSIGSACLGIKDASVHDLSAEVPALGCRCMPSWGMNASVRGVQCKRMWHGCRTASALLCTRRMHSSAASTPQNAWRGTSASQAMLPAALWSAPSAWSWCVQPCVPPINLLQLYTASSCPDRLHPVKCLPAGHM